MISCFVEMDTWEDVVVVKHPCDMRRWGAIRPTGQQEALPLLQRHISKQLSEDGVSLDGQGHCPSVLAEFVDGNAGIPASILRLVDGGQQAEKCRFMTPP